MRNRSRLGFTLIELLVVIAIIAILAAILFPVFISAKKAAMTATCKSNLQQIHKATTMYLDDWQGTMFANVSFPGVWGNPGPTGTEFTRQGLMGWVETLWRYHHKVEIYRCPTYYANYCYSLNGFCEGSRAPKRPSITVTYFDCPGSGNSRADGGKGVVFPKGKNDVLSGDSNIQCGNADGSSGGQLEGQCSYTGEYRSYAWMPRNAAEMTTFNQPSYTKFRFLLFPGPHGGANNVLFWDGHVATVFKWKPGEMTMWMRGSPGW